ncbi:MAG: ABC transporter substrate-binding protein [Dehalococcoidia bacterium]|nr:ABC transporter substrate-binding protein [Dehalococcoidia bacterium]
MTPALLTPSRPLVAPPEDATRREFITGVGAAALAAAFLAACGDDDAAGETPAATESSTRTITHEYGTFELPLSPQRVVALDGRPGFEAALALGFQPIAIGQDAVVDGELAPLISFDHEDVPLINPNDVDFEALIQLDPELIIGRDFQLEQALEQLTAIAPILPIRLDDHWRLALTRLADWLERRLHVDAELAKYDEQVAAIQERHAGRLTTAKVALLEYGVSDRTFYRNPHYVQALTLQDLGGRENTFLSELPGNSFSIEQLGELNDVEAILVCGYGDAHERLEEEALWQRLPAVAAGRVVKTDIRTNYGGLYAATGCLDLWDRVYQTLA